MIRKYKKDLSNIYSVLKKPKIKFKVNWLPDGWLGAYEGDKITINIPECILETLLHECLHDIYPRMGEKKIEIIAHRIYSQMNYRQKRYIIKLFNKRILKK